MSLYEVLRKLDGNHNNVVYTVIDGPDFGAKALFSEGELIWEAPEGAFFDQHASDVQSLQKTGTYTIAGEKIFAEVVGCERHLVICGGGHVSIPVIKIGLMLGFRVTVLEDRPKFANDARRAGATEVICDSFAAGLEQIEGDPNTWFVIVTRGHRYDQVCLEAIAKKEHAYIGMIGSRLRVKKVLEVLVENGADEEVLKNVHTPIGLDIGAETPEEIAVSIMGEIIQEKNKKNSNSGYTKQLLRSIMDLEVEGGRKILTTIVSRKGSAPRGLGTKMLILPGGECIGTIGGGCVEADVFRKGLRMLHTDSNEPQIFTVDMTGQDAEEEGMVCGGTVDILFEVV